MYDKENAEGGNQGKGWDLLERRQFISACGSGYMSGREEEGDGWLSREMGG